MSLNARSAASGGSQVSVALAWLSRFRVALLPFASIVALVIYFTAVNPLFFSASNALNIGRQSSVLLLVSQATKSPQWETSVLPLLRFWPPEATRGGPTSLRVPKR